MLLLHSLAETSKWQGLWLVLRHLLAGGFAPSATKLGGARPCKQTHVLWRVALSCTLLLMVARSAFAAPFGGEDKGWEGLTEFVGLAKKVAGSDDVRMVQTLDWSLLRPADSIVFVHPTRSIAGAEMGAFLKAGGRMAVLDDFGKGADIVSRYGIKRVPLPRRPRQMLRKRPGLALAVPAVEKVGGRSTGVHPVVAGVSRLVTNHGTGFVHPDLSSVLKVQGDGEPDVVFAVAGQVGNGRLFVVGDGSVVMNQMLRYPANRRFASALCDYLWQDDSWGKRQGRIYILANGFSERGSYGGQSKRGRQLSEILARIGVDLQDIANHGLPKQLQMALAVVAATGLVIWVATAAARKYRVPNSRIARSRPLVLHAGPPAKAAALAAPTTQAGLVVLEQKRALERMLTVLLGPQRASGQLLEMVQFLRQNGEVSPSAGAEIEAVAERMLATEDVLGSGRRPNVPADLVERGQSVLRLVSGLLKPGALALAGRRRLCWIVPERPSGGCPRSLGRLFLSIGLRPWPPKAADPFSERPIKGIILANHPVTQQEVQWTKDTLERLRTTVGQVFVGKASLVDGLLVALLTKGHALLEGVPGVAKTTLVKTFAQALGLSVRRIQFTPDLLPADITGSYVLSPKEGTFKLRPGPIFANVVMADEINRAPAKAQSALLECMQEAQTTIEGDRFELPKPFLVLATQNPIDLEGTYPLPEAQLDRFLILLPVGYPTAKEEVSMLRNHAQGPPAVGAALRAEDVVQLQAMTARVHMDDDLFEYVASLAAYTRNQQGVLLGVSPRGSLAMVRAAKAMALVRGRGYVAPDDIQELMVPVFGHRLILSPELEGDSGAVERLLGEASKRVPYRRSAKAV